VIVRPGQMGSNHPHRPSPISIRSMLAVVLGVSNFIQTRFGHSARSFREGAPSIR
jgi:hypothetical protein